jgi:hypothetical protein
VKYGAARAHGGSISVQSEVGKEITFMVTMPIEPRTEENQDIWVNLPESSNEKEKVERNSVEP